MVWGRRSARAAMRVAEAALKMQIGADARVVEDLDPGPRSPLDMSAMRTYECFILSGF